MVKYKEKNHKEGRGGMRVGFIQGSRKGLAKKMTSELRPRERKGIPTWISEVKKNMSIRKKIRKDRNHPEDLEQHGQRDLIKIKSPHGEDHSPPKDIGFYFELKNRSGFLSRSSL